MKTTKMMAAVVLAFGMLFGLGGAAKADIITNMIGWWKFDEASSGTGTGTAIDSSLGTTPGGVHNGAINGGAVYTAGHIGGGALTFDGSDDYVDCGGTGTQLELVGTSYTISWWMKVAANTTAHRIITMDDANDYSGGYSFNFSPATTGKITWSHNNGNNNNTQFGPAITLNVWEQRVMVYDSAAPAGSQRKEYVNGVYYASASVSGAGLTTDGNDPLCFGAILAHGQYYTGALDDIRIYNRALTAGDVTELYNYVEPSAVPEPASAGMVAVGLVGLLIRRRRK